jgi:polyphosphate glucokinase
MSSASVAWRLGKKAWRRVVRAIVPLLMEAFLADYVVLGGGNAKQLTRLPPGIRLGHNQTAFRGGFRLWTLEDVQTLAGDEAQPALPLHASEWRLI